MNKKPLQKPRYVLKLEALLRRIPPNHPKTPQIMKKLARALAGYRGEQSLEYYLSFLPHKEFLIFHGLRLPLNRYFFQMDVLIVTSTFMLIIEVKNISGTLIFDHRNSQLIRQYDGNEEIFSDPIDQVHHQWYQLKQWLSRYHFPKIKIEVLVVVTNQSSKIQSPSPETKIPDVIIRSSTLISKIETFKDRYTVEQFTKRQLNKLSRQLISQHTEYDPDLLEQFQISASDILQGVFCPFCELQKMTRTSGVWSCPQCFYVSKHEHETALADYALLIGPTITNRQFRNFTGLQSESTAKRILQSMDLAPTGSKKGRVYELSGLSKGTRNSKD